MSWRRAAFAIVALAGACRTPGHLSPGSGGAAAELRSRWVGRTQDEVLAELGLPDEVRSRPAGGWVLLYRSDRIDSTALDDPAFAWNVHARPTMERVTCERSFAIDRATGRIVDASLEGDGCGASR